MAKVKLDFVPPIADDITTLHIYESVLQDGPFNEIEVVTPVGTYPDYITDYTTSNALSITDWFSIAWENVDGILGPRAAPIKGGTRTPVQEILDRVLQRDPSLSEAIVVQSAEFVISYVMNVLDPYDPTITMTPNQLEGITLMTMARASIQRFLVSASSSSSYTAGLVSQKADSSSSTQSLDRLIEWLTAEANRLLGISNSLVMVLEDIDPTGMGGVSSIQWDHSRLALTVNYE